MGAVTVAVVQAAPVSFDVRRTLEKTADLAADAARRGARLALFPEAFVSAYPRGLDFGAVVGSRTEAGREQFRRYWESAIDVPGPDDLTADGDFWEHEYQFSRRGRVVATVSKRFFSWTDTYGVETAPEADDLLILASTVVIDLCCHGKK